MAEKTAGQEVVERMEAWIRSFVVFPERIAEGAPLVCALYALNTWVYQVWSSTPYLCISAATKGAGKSVLLECLQFLSFHSELVAGPTIASLYRMADMYQGYFSLYWDEAERLSAQNAGPTRDLLNPGYRKGATMPRTARGGEGVIKFPVYWPKCFALIGDLYSTLRDRSIVIGLERATPGQLRGIKHYRRDDAERESSAIRQQIEALIVGLHGTEAFAVTEADWVSGREEELLTPLYSLAHVLGLDKATMRRFRIASADLSALKTQEAVYYTNSQRAEDEARDVSYGERAVRDLASVLKEGEASIGSAEAVKRMRALESGPWRTFKGNGLNEISLAALVARFNVAPGRLPRKRGEVQRKGYRKAAIVAAAKI